ncbi:hypothetical protein COCVIDRAFT_28487 [Bipolaris victoriae FI3]|uniref:Uncharacterized protein n=1 Tax=Bipolaris victoriae (strain FI3) TaxID=930091 RepID=W7EGP0_BIPV3|nr:hypothetical protein COCVIDRAFT_28487 [Bipolaris victoriae FI3]
MSSSHSDTTATATATVHAPPVYSTLSPPSYTASASSDTNSVRSRTSVSKKVLGKMWNTRHEEKVGKGKEEKQRNVEEKEVRAEARAVYFALQ